MTVIALIPVLVFSASKKTRKVSDKKTSRTRLAIFDCQEFTFVNEWQAS